MSNQDKQVQQLSMHMDSLLFFKLFISVTSIVAAIWIDRFIIKTILSKQMLMITILDLINIDTLILYASLGTFVMCSNAFLDLESQMPDFVAHFLGFGFFVGTTCFLLYLNFGVILRYIIIKRKDMNFFYDDYKLRMIIQLSTFSVGLTMALAFEYLGYPFLFHLIFLNQFQMADQEINVSIALLALAAVNNMLLRTLIYVDGLKDSGLSLKDKFKNAFKCNSNAVTDYLKDDVITFTSLLILTLVISGYLFFMEMIEYNNESYERDFVRIAHILMFIMTPIMVILTQNNLREKFLIEIRNKFGENRCRRKVYPSSIQSQETLNSEV